MNGNEIPERFYLISKHRYVRLFCPRGFLARTELLDIFFPYKIGNQWKENNLGPQ